MYAICKSTHPATEVEHSIYCSFYNYNERNLLTAGANQLKVYRLVRDPTKPDTDKYVNRSFEYANLDATYMMDNVKLECLQVFSVSGRIDSLNSVSFAGSSRDCLLLTFTEAKVSIVEYDPNTHDLKTISMHYFEDDEMKEGFMCNVKPSLLRVDPENRCAALLIYGKNIIIIPFRKDIVIEEPDSLFLSTATSSNYSNKKSPVLPSYKLDLPSEQYGLHITNIVDIQFLHNYYEPTLLILYEPVRTWAGRVAVRQDTVSMITLSLDVHQRVHPHIWSVSNLPFNTFAALPVPKPIGGVLIFAANSLIHLNQGLPPFGVSLNGFNDSNTSFPLKTYDGLTPISLDCSQACFISNNKILLSLNDGDLYVLNLHNDMTRSLRTFNFNRLASSVIATTLTKCEDGFIFLGSRLSHSLLLYYYEKMTSQSDGIKEKSAHLDSQSLAKLIAAPSFDETEKTEDEYLYGDEFCRTQKKIKLEVEIEKDVNATQPDPIRSRSNSSMEEDETIHAKPITENIILENIENGEMNLDETNENSADSDDTEKDIPPKEVINIETNEHLLKVSNTLEEKEPTFLLKLCDIIYNIGPCANVTLGEPNIPCDNLANSKDFAVELVTISGFQRTGALTALQRTIKPQIETSFKLPGCLDAWTVYGPNYYTEQEETPPTHEYLILDQEDSTIVFQIGQEINELDHSGFITQSGTVFTGNLGNRRYILQVCASSVRLLDGTHELQHFPLDLGSPIVYTSLADPYAVLMTRDGQVLRLHLKIDPHNGSARLVISKPDLSGAKSKITALCVYNDTSGLFTCEGRVIECVKAKNLTKKQNTNVPSLTSTLSTLTSATTADEEDELLYGDSAVYFLGNNANDLNEDEDKDDIKLTTVSRKESTFWLFFVRENGVLEIYNLLDFKLVYLVKNFPLGSRVLVDSIQTTDHSYQSQMDTSAMPITTEILITGMGLHQSRPFLFARFDDELFIYEVFPYFESQVEHHLKIRFKKNMSHNVFVKVPTMFLSKDNSRSDVYTRGLPSTNTWLRPFTNIGGYSGVFLCGPFPCWFIMTHRGELRVHSMDIDGAVTSFAMFNNANCPNGFFYFNVDEELRISQLPTYFELDSYWPFKHIPIGETIHYINYHLDSKTYAIVKSRQVSVDKIVRIGGDEKDYEAIEHGSNYIPCTTEQFALELLSPTTWEVIPGSHTELDEWEHVTCLKNVNLSSEGTSSGLKGYIVLGTNYAYGEDVTNRGRIWIIDIIEVVPEPGKPLTKNKLKMVYCKEQKGPVTALCQVKGYLLSAIGQKIYIWQLKEAQLIGIAFIDTQIYVHSAVSLRNLILIGDIYKSISLLRYQEETRTLSLVSRDQKPLQVYACEYMIDNTQMCFVVSDSDKNLIIYTYQPDTLESHGGMRLLRRADFYLGSHVNAFFRIRCNIPSKDMEPRLKQTYVRKHITMFATLDGSLGYLLPISEKTYRRLLMLQNLLTTNIQHIAGLNPKAFRMVKLHRLELSNPSKNILDGDLLFKYLNLALNEKMELAKKIGTSTKQVIDDLQEIYCITSHF